MRAHRIYCSQCGQSVYNCVIYGVRTPLVASVNFGQAPDTGPQFDCNAPGVKLPSGVRAYMATPMPRVELCMACYAEWLGVPLVTADEDPSLDENLRADAHITPALQADVASGAVDELTAHRTMMAPAFAATVQGRTAQAKRATPLVRRPAIIDDAPASAPAPSADAVPATDPTPAAA